ncbi:hypothetical protein PTKIN_Ptkin14bG0210300 [Pterospermum kingtungense]
MKFWWQWTRRCNLFVNLMEGHIWIENEGLGKVCTAIFIVKLGIPECLNESQLFLMPKVPTNHGPTAFPGLKVLVMDENGFEIRIRMESGSVGYGCGVIFGMFMGYVVFSTGKPQWLVRLVEEYQPRGKLRRPRNGRRRHGNRGNQFKTKVALEGVCCNACVLCHT